MSKKVECSCVVPDSVAFLGIPVPIVPSLGLVPRNECQECNGTGKVKLRVPLCKANKSVGIICRVCGRYQRVSMGSYCQQASACSRHLEVRV